jgi:N6-L-threonylcarbamoyladenine synthase
VPVVRAALAQANVTLTDLDAIAVTSGPGLAGALLVGITYAKALAFAGGLPLVAVNHLEGHIHAVLLNQRASGQPDQGAPQLALVVSGGHTHLYLARPVDGTWSYALVGRTLDDAAGEAFDKVAKLLGLGYPGGPWIDALAQFGNPHAVPFAFAQIKTKLHLAGKAPRTKAATTAPIAELDPHFLFSFSGIKTAVLRYVELHNLRPEAEARRTALFTGPDAPARPSVEDALAMCDPTTLDLIASFQRAVVGDLMKKTFGAAESLGVGQVLVTGGVAANRELRTRFTAEAARRGVTVSFPTLELSTDNAAMIAAAAWPKFQAGDFAARDLSAEPSLALGTLVPAR